MTAALERAPELPLRLAVRIAWAGHRALYPFSGTRITVQEATP
jgi:hypothetical protein